MSSAESEDGLKQLMALALAGEGRAYQALLLACADRLRKYYRRRLPDGSADVEDLVQETLLAVHGKRASYSPALPFSAWLHGIARHKLIDFLRRQGRQAAIPIDDAGELADGSDPHAALAALDVDRLLAALPAKQAKALRLTRLGGLSVREAGEEAGQSEPAVKVNVHRGLQRLIAMVRDSR